MNREDIIRMALEAGAIPIRGEPKQLAIVTNLMIERFAALVAAAEREACAQIGEAFDKERPQSNYGRCLAVAIRARGNGGAK